MILIHEIGRMRNGKLLIEALCRPHLRICFQRNSSSRHDVDLRRLELDNVSKIEIAKEAVNVLLEDWTPSEPLGVVAYGHRQTRSCNDIEVVAQPGSTFGKIRRAVRDVFPKGRTPLTDALLAASRTLFTNQAKNPTLILLTDGVDTCQKDPCEVAARLKGYRADFRVHVVGFSMKDSAKDSIKCLSDQTGGQFFRRKAGKASVNP